jgi:phosphatidylserine/phosphatidylglycerophosphate/cardiolipin synthase-like enzyme
LTRRFLVVSTAALLLPCPLDAQPAATAADPLALVHSMGKPPVWKPFTGGFYGIDRSGDSDRSGGGAYVGLYKDLMPSIVGVGVSGEGYLGGYSGLSGVNGGVRALAELRSLFLKAGVDYDFQRDDTSFILSLTVPLRRGGILGHGTHLRVDWLPGRGNSWTFGLQVPLEPHMGKTRPRDTEVDMPKARKPAPVAPASPAVAAAMQEVRLGARAVAVLSTAFWPDDRSDRLKSLEKSQAQMRDFVKIISATSPRRPQGARMENEVNILHDQLDLAFGLAAGAPEGEARPRGAPLAAIAREVVLDEVLYPYNRLFGQYKRPDELWGLAARARDRFGETLGAAALTGGHGAAVRAVFEDYLRVIEETRAWWVKRLEADSRLAWLPFQLALRPEQHDTQAEIDAILSRAQETPLVGGNTVFYWNGQQWQLSLHRTIHQARDYHVLWLHDYDGIDPAGDVDVVGYYISVEGYLNALTERVREFDRTGKLPVYMILVDLNYWEANKGRLYTDLLQDPLHARARLPKQDVAENRGLQERTEKALAELREAVKSSKRLQEEAARRGPDWLRKYVSVHLNVMNPADFSFRTSRLVGYLPIAPDTMVRDHRKIVFYDLTERDPGKGAALFGGVGVGEQYATATWEDRAVRLTGPAALTLKDAARRYLGQNGVKPEDIPAPLQPLPKPADYDERVKALEARGWTATAMEVHNDRGFARKDASIASAVLYTLMPPDSLIVVPDSIWTHELWAAHLVGAALRGCHVYVIAPAVANAPSAGFPQLSRTREIWSRFVEVQKILGPEIEARGGRLRTGLYTRRSGVNDIQAQLGEMHETFARYPFLKEDFPFPPEFYAGVGKGEEFLAATGYKPDERLPEDAKARSPKLHRKTQLFVTRDALAALVRDRRTQDVIANQVKFTAQKGIVFDPDDLARSNVDLASLFFPYLEAFRDLPESTRRSAVLYMTVGSLNKDARGMMTDGEVLQVTAGAWAMWAVADMWMLTGATTWIESQEELDRLLPPYKQWQRRVGRWVRKVI